MIPTDFTQLILWLTADKGITLRSRNEYFVRNWSDQSEFAHHAVQEIANRQPVYLTNSTSGLPGLSFDGVHAALRIPTVNYNGSTGITVAGVWSDKSTDVNSVIFEGGLGSDANSWSIFANSTAGPLSGNNIEVRVAMTGYENGAEFFESLDGSKRKKRAGKHRSRRKVKTDLRPHRIITTIDRTIVGAVGRPEMRIWCDGIEQTLVQTGVPPTGQANITGTFANIALNLSARDNGSALGWKAIRHEDIIYNRILSDAEVYSLDQYFVEHWRL